MSNNGEESSCWCFMLFEVPRNLKIFINLSIICQKATESEWKLLKKKHVAEKRCCSSIYKQTSIFEKISAIFFFLF